MKRKTIFVIEFVLGVFCYINILLWAVWAVLTPPMYIGFNPCLLLAVIGLFTGLGFSLVRRAKEKKTPNQRYKYENRIFTGIFGIIGGILFIFFILLALKYNFITYPLLLLISFSIITLEIVICIIYFAIGMFLVIWNVKKLRDPELNK